MKIGVLSPAGMCLGLILAVMLWPVPPARAQDDPYEPNNSTNDATDLTSLPSTWLSDYLGTGRQCDNDWYRIFVAPGRERVMVDCRYVHSRGNIVIYLYDSNAVMITWSDGWVDGELLDYVVATSGTYYVQVAGVNGCNAYNLQWFTQAPGGPLDDPYEYNDTASSAYNLREARATPLSALAGLGAQCNPDWYAIYVAPGSERLIAQCSFTNTPGALGMNVRDVLGNLVFTYWGAGGEAFVDALVPAPGLYFLEVRGDDACKTYDLWWDSRVPPGRVGPPVVVALFYNHSYVDTSTLADGEAYNLLKTLDAMSVRVNTFTGITEAAFNTALAEATVLLIPELELGNLSADLSAGAISAISGFVAGGGCLILHGEQSGNDQALASAVFGFSVQQQGDYTGLMSTNTGATAGTPFEGGPPSLGGENGLCPWLTSSLPAGSASLYQFESGGNAMTTVGVVPYGAGHVVFLAWDWWNGAPRGPTDNGWNSILFSSLAQCSCEAQLTDIRSVGANTRIGVDTGFKHTYEIAYTDESLKIGPRWWTFLDPSLGIGQWTETAPLGRFAFTDDYTAATSGWPSPTMRRTYRMNRRPAKTASEVAVLANSSYVDMGLMPGSEGFNMQAALQRLRYKVDTFTGITEQAFRDALRPGEFLVIPELENGNLLADLSPGAKSVITNFVMFGGKLIVFPDDGTRDEDLVNDLFGFSISGVGDLTGIASVNVAPGAKYPAYAVCPPVVPGNNGLYPWNTASLPAGADTIYQLTYSGTNYSSAVVITQGMGFVVFLGWDWFDGAPLGEQDGGWREVLEASFQTFRRKNLFVGYYDMGWGQGNINQIPPIQTADHMPVFLDNVASQNLYGLDVLFVQNPDNEGYGAEYTNNLEAIRQAVMGGMTLIIHDRAVTNSTASLLPGGESIGFTRDISLLLPNDIQIKTSGTWVTGGPGGALDNSSLDNGNLSCQGYADEASLPPGAVNILSRGAAAEAVTFAYPYGAGWVVYSSIPLDWFLDGHNPAAFRDTYAPNVVEFGCMLY